MESTPEEIKVYVAVGKNVEEGVPMLRWALNHHWSSSHQPVSFVILHVNSTSSMDFVLTPFGKVPASSLNDCKLDALRARENERVDRLLCKYIALCSKVKAEILKVDTSDEPIGESLVGLISSNGIKKLVMGFKTTKSTSWRARSENCSWYVQKHKPEFCELFVVHGGKQAMYHEDNVDEGGYYVDESGVTIADFRKKLKEKGSFMGWLGSLKGNVDDRRSSPSTEDRKSTASPRSAISPSNADEATDGKWEYNAEEIESYVQSLSASDSPEKEQEETECQLEITNTDIFQTFGNKTEIMRAIEQVEKVAKQKKIEMKSDQERRRKAEQVVYACNHKAEEMEANMRDEMTKSANLQREVDTVRAQISEAVGNVMASKNKLASELDQQGVLTMKLEAYSMKQFWLEDMIANEENKCADISRQVEEIRRENEFSKRRIDWYMKREAMANANGLNCDCREFSEEELRDATDNFSDKLLVASSSQSRTYRGVMNHTNVSVKFKTAYLDSLEEFKAQIGLLSRINHPHILTMIGACAERRCIVFEYMQRGSMHDILFPSPSSRGNPVILPWHTRIKIAAAVCSALGFLHSSQPKPTAHGRLDSSHVLLDHNLHAKITGISATTSASPAADILSLGLLIVRLLTRNERIGMQGLRVALESGSLSDTLDQTAGDWPLELATKFARIALHCSTEEKHAALSMGDIMQEVEDLRSNAELEMARGGDHNKLAQGNVPDSFLCPIFQEVMKEPYVAADGFSYEMEAIQEWLKTGHETSPMTNLKLRNKILTPNYTLQCLIMDWHHKS